MITAAPAQERFTQHAAIHLVERLRFDDRDADAFISTKERLRSYDESAAALLTGRVERREACDEDDEPPLPRGRLEHARWNRRVADARVGQLA